MSTTEPPLAAVAVIGLGMIGRHHARLLQTSPRVRFAGAVDPGGDRHGSLHDPELCHGSVAELLQADPPQGAIVSVPTSLHLAVAGELMAAGVSVLVEKPLAPTVAEAEQLVALAERHGVAGAVGHVERFNAAPRELRRRLREGQLGRPAMVATVRSGPFPGRITDAGVVMDLATHDIDLISWLSDSHIATLAAQAQHLSGGAHEDLVFVNGRLDSGAVFNLVADRVSPTKIRRTRVLGEGGMLEADTLTGDLSFYANAAVGIDWPMAQQFRGVSEGDVTRYALRREEPLQTELDGFLDLLAGDPEADVVTLREGVEIVRVAETILHSASSGTTLTTNGAR